MGNPLSDGVTSVRLRGGHFHFSVLHVQGQRLCSKEPQQPAVRQSLLGGSRTTVEISIQVIEEVCILTGKLDAGLTPF